MARGSDPRRRRDVLYDAACRGDSIQFRFFYRTNNKSAPALLLSPNSACIPPQTHWVSCIHLKMVDMLTLLFWYTKLSLPSVRVEQAYGFTYHLDEGRVCPPRVQSADRHHRHSHCGWRIPHRLAVDHRGHSKLHQAERGSRHLARIALSLADSNVLVRTALDRALRGLHYRDPWDRPPLHVVTDHAARTLVPVSHHSRLGHA